MSQALDRIRKVAKERKKEKFTALFHHLSLDPLEQAFFDLKDNAAPGVDGVTWSDYEGDLERNLEDLFSRLHRGAYRQRHPAGVHPQTAWSAAPACGRRLGRQVGPACNGRDLERIYEEDFLGSVRVPPWAGSARCARRPLCRNYQQEGELHIGRRHPVVLRTASQEWLIRFVEHRICDKRIIRQVQKWLKAGVLEDGVVTAVTGGLGRGR